MDGEPPPPNIPPDPDDPARYSVSSRRDATAPKDSLSGCSPADTSLLSQSVSSSSDDSAMDTSVVSIPSAGMDSAMDQQSAEVPSSDTPGGSRARRTPSPTPTASSLPSTSALASQGSQGAAGSEELPLASVTASMENLAMADPPVVQRRAPRAASPSAPLAKTQRSASGRRRAPANYAAAVAGSRSPPPPNPAR
ncbi:hypothetical protein TELCIR_22466, partial [Teladorsagia circumcincta]